MARQEYPRGFNGVHPHCFPWERPAYNAIIVGPGAEDNLIEVISKSDVPD